MNSETKRPVSIAKIAAIACVAMVIMAAVAWVWLTQDERRGLYRPAVGVGPFTTKQYSDIASPVAFFGYNHAYYNPDELKKYKWTEGESSPEIVPGKFKIDNDMIELVAIALADPAQAPEHSSSPAPTAKWPVTKVIDRNGIPLNAEMLKKLPPGALVDFKPAESPYWQARFIWQWSAQRPEISNLLYVFDTSTLAFIDEAAPNTESPEGWLFFEDQLDILKLRPIEIQLDVPTRPIQVETTLSLTRKTSLHTPFFDFQFGPVVFHADLWNEFSIDETLKNPLSISAKYSPDCARLYTQFSLISNNRKRIISGNVDPWRDPGIGLIIFDDALRAEETTPTLLRLKIEEHCCRIKLSIPLGPAPFAGENIFEQPVVDWDFKSQKEAFFFALRGTWSSDNFSNEGYPDFDFSKNKTFRYNHETLGEILQDSMPADMFLSKGAGSDEFTLEVTEFAKIRGELYGWWFNFRQRFKR